MPSSPHKNLPDLTTCFSIIHPFSFLPDNKLPDGNFSADLVTRPENLLLGCNTGWVYAGIFIQFSGFFLNPYCL
jgi:hypothetical protein